MAQPIEVLEYAQRLETSYTALCKMVGPSISTTMTVLSQIYGPDVAERAGKALSGFPTETFREDRVRCQAPWNALQTEAIAIIGDVGIEPFEVLCSETRNKMRDGAYLIDDGDFLDHHKSGIVSVVAGTEDVIQFNPQSVKNAKQYLKYCGVL